MGLASWHAYTVRTQLRGVAGSASRRAVRGPVARAGIGAVVGVGTATVAHTIGSEAISPDAAGSLVDAVWIGLAAALACQLVLGAVAFLVPDEWRATRRG
jgi:hypothetical protein